MGWVKRRAASFGHAFRGLRWVALNERNGKYHIAHAAVCAMASPLVGPEPVAFALLSLGMECMNSAAERAVDLAVGGERKKLAKIGKDTASAAVLCSLTAAAIIDLRAIVQVVTSLV